MVLVMVMLSFDAFDQNKFWFETLYCILVFLEIRCKNPNPHILQVATFQSAQQCSYCLSILQGMSRQGLQCQ
eukprot:Awhi_evm1s6675